MDENRSRLACTMIAPAPATSGADLAAAMLLFRAYADSLPIDLDRYGLGDEIAGLPGPYAPPGGGLWIARGPAGAASGCVALRPLRKPGICEMKRLCLCPEARGTGFGRALAVTAIFTARAAGYREMRLDTLPSPTSAIGLYRDLGFRAIANYNYSPFAGTPFFALALWAQAKGPGVSPGAFAAVSEDQSVPLRCWIIM